MEGSLFFVFILTDFSPYFPINGGDVLRVLVPLLVVFAQYATNLFVDAIFAYVYEYWCKMLDFSHDRPVD